MAGPQAEAAKALANLLSKVARYSVLLGIGGSALQASLYTGTMTMFRGSLSIGARLCEKSPRMPLDARSRFLGPLF